MLERAGVQPHSNRDNHNLKFSHANLSPAVGAVPAIVQPAWTIAPVNWRKCSASPEAVRAGPVNNRSSHNNHRQQHSHAINNHRLLRVRSINNRRPASSRAAFLQMLALGPLQT